MDNIQRGKLENWDIYELIADFLSKVILDELVECHKLAIYYFLADYCILLFRWLILSWVLVYFLLIFQKNTELLPFSRVDIL